jgi:hypothetical protein
LNAEEYTSAVELARTTVGSACAPMEYTPLHQHRGRGLFGVAGQFALFPLPVSDHDKGPGTWRILEVLDPLDAACRGLVLEDHERWDRGRPFFLGAGWEIADGKHGGGFGGAQWTWLTDDSALEGETHLHSRMREVYRAPFCTAFFLRVPRWPTMSSCAPIRIYGEGIISSTGTVMRLYAAVRRRG